MKSEMELERQATRRMDSLQMLSMCAMRSSLAAEASCSVFAYFLKDNGMKVQQENVLPFTAGRAGFSKGQW